MKKVLIVAILGLLGVATFPSIQPLSLKAADTLPTQYTDAEFWHFVNDFSEPGGNFQYENFVSNEVSYMDVLPDLTPRWPGIYWH